MSHADRLAAFGCTAPKEMLLSRRSPDLFAVVESCEAGIYGAVAQRFLDAEQLVVFGNTLGPGRRTGLDLAGVQSNCQVSDSGVFGLA